MFPVPCFCARSALRKQIFCQNILYRRMAAYIHIVLLQKPDKSRRHIGGVIRDGKNTAAALHFDRTSVFFKEVLDHPVVKAIDGAVQKLGVSHNMAEKLLRVTVIGQIASSLPSDIDLFSRLFIFFQHDHPVPFFRRRSGGHQPGRAGTDYNDCFFHPVTSMIFPLYFHDTFLILP